MKNQTNPSLQPVMILVRPQLSQNIGMVARAMLNFGLTQLRLVTPQESWTNATARSLAAGADDVLEKAALFPSLEEAVKDLHVVYATTARPRDMIKAVSAPSQALPEVHRHLQKGLKVGIVFGPEKSGLQNDEVALADQIITVPLNPGFSSLNLAQSVVLLAYEWFQASQIPFVSQTAVKESERAPLEEVNFFLCHLDTELEKAGYFRTAHKREIMARNLKNIFYRLPLHSQEIKTLRGVISTLVNPLGLYSRKPKRLKKKIDKA